MGGIVVYEANAVLASSVAGVTYNAPVTPIKLALITSTTASTNSMLGSEVSGGSYSRQTITWATPSAESISNNAVVTFTGMPACTVAGIELWDSSTRTVTDGVTNSTTTITSATASFTAGDVGKVVTGSSDIPAGTVIISVTNSTTAILSASATGSHTSQTFNIGPGRRWFGLLGTSKTVASGDSISFAIGAVQIGLS